MAFAVVRPVHVAVQDASLARLALAGPNGTALAYDVSLAIAVAGGVFRLALKLAGDVRYPPHRHVQRLNVTCPLELPLSSATAVTRFTKVKCV
jgi:hypothetical protein